MDMTGVAIMVAKISTGEAASTLCSARNEPVLRSAFLLANIVKPVGEGTGRFRIFGFNEATSFAGRDVEGEIYFRRSTPPSAATL